jgi:sugar phosphate permease
VVRAHGLEGGFAELSVLLAAAGVGAFLLVRAPSHVATASGEANEGGLRDSGIGRLSIASGLLAIAQMSLASFLVLFLVQVRHWSTAHAGVALVISFGIGAAVRLGSGRWSDCGVPRTGVMRSIVVVGITLLAATAAFVSGPDAILVPLLVGATALAASWNGLAATAVTEFADVTRIGQALGVQITTIWLFQTGAPAAFGVIVTVFSWRTGFAALAVVQLAAILVLAPLIAVERARHTVVA